MLSFTMEEKSQSSLPRLISHIIIQSHLLLMRGNALMISSRCQDDNFPPAEIDGVE